MLGLHWIRRPLVQRRLAALLLPLCGVISCADFASAQIPDVPGWELFWNDEFEGTSLNEQNWEALDRKNSFNNEKQYYHPDQVTLADGNLQLTAINVPREGKDYQSGLITSKDLFGPGRFEARVNLPTSQGMWPAFWLNANQVSWPQGGEIDILENRGSQPNLVSSAYHWQTDPGPCCGAHEYVFNEYTATEGGQPVNYHAGFHTYAAEWDDTSIRYYVDGELHFTVNEEPNRPVFETPKNIIVNLAVGGIFGGDPDGTTVWPQTMLVDYVRVWQRPDDFDPGDPGDPDPGDPSVGANLLSNPSFEAASGSLENWDVFGNRIPNVSSSAGLANDGTHAAKIFGQFTGQTNLSGVTQGVAITEGALLRAVASTRSPQWDTLAGKENEVTMKLEFYSDFGAAADSADFLGEVSQLIHDGSSPEDIWLDHTLEAIAPENAVEARLSFIFRQQSNDNGAIWIDSAGLFVEITLNGDYNGDGTVDAADYTVWRAAMAAGDAALLNDSTPGTVDESDYQVWRANYGATSSQATTADALVATVPEPASLMIAFPAWLLLHTRRQR